MHAGNLPPTEREPHQPATTAACLCKLLAVFPQSDAPHRHAGVDEQKQLRRKRQDAEQVDCGEWKTFGVGVMCGKHRQVAATGGAAPVDKQASKVANN